MHLSKSGEFEFWGQCGGGVLNWRNFKFLMNIIVKLFISNSLGLGFKLQGALTSLPPHTHIRAMPSNACSDSAVSKYVLIWSVLKKWKKIAANVEMQINIAYIATCQFWKSYNFYDVLRNIKNKCNKKCRCFLCTNYLNV